MSNAHGWATGPGGAMTASVLGIRADLKNAPKAKASPTAFVVAPQPSGLEWCVGRLSFANHHNVDVVWNVTEAASGRERTFVLDLDLSAAHAAAHGRVELPLHFPSPDSHHRGSDAALAEEDPVDITIEVDGEVVERRTLGAAERGAVYAVALPTPLRSQRFVVRRTHAQL